MDLNLDRQKLWENAFRFHSPDLDIACPKEAMEDCAEFFLGRNVGEILDIGSGLGHWAMYLASRGYLVQGFDFSPHAVEYARQWGMREKLAVEFECAAVTEFPFPGEIFDAAIATRVLDILTPREMAMTIDQMARFVRRGGVAFALFHSYTGSSESPSVDIKPIPYKDSELRRMFPGFRLLEFRSYPGGLRGLFMKRE